MTFLINTRGDINRAECRGRRRPIQLILVPGGLRPFGRHRHVANTATRGRPELVKLPIEIPMSPSG